MFGLLLPARTGSCVSDHYQTYLKGCFPLKASTKCLLPFLGFTYWGGEKYLFRSICDLKPASQEVALPVPAIALGSTQPTSSWCSGLRSPWFTAGCTRPWFYTCLSIILFWVFHFILTYFFPKIKYTHGFLVTAKYLWFFLLLFLILIFFPTFRII